MDRENGTILEPKNILVLLGAHNIDQQNETGRVSFSAELIFIHDQWNSSSLKFKNDVALIKLNETVTFNQYIQPACLPTTDLMHKNHGTVVGWGVYNDNGRVSDYPREIEVPILDAFDCISKNVHLVPIFDKKTMFCAGRDGAGICPGDSGSGLYVEDKGIFYVKGLVSSSTYTSCSRTNYVLYSDILNNWSFIKKVKMIYIFLTNIFLTFNDHFVYIYMRSLL